MPLRKRLFNFNKRLLLIYLRHKSYDTLPYPRIAPLHRRRAVRRECDCIGCRQFDSTIPPCPRVGISWHSAPRLSSELKFATPYRSCSWSLKNTKTMNKVMKKMVAFFSEFSQIFDRSLQKDISTRQWPIKLLWIHTLKSLL